MRAATLRRFMASHNFDEELELHRLDCLAGSGDLSNWEFVVEKRKELALEPLPEAPLLRGRDLLRLGFVPGPRMGEILEELEEKRLEGALKSAEEAERWVKENYSSGVRNFSSPGAPICLGTSIFVADFQEDGPTFTKTSTVTCSHFSFSNICSGSCLEK
jgi:hypothetical protein